MSRKHVYLAGPILGCDRSGANDWRYIVDDTLNAMSNGEIRGVSPLRCEPLIGDTYGTSHPDPRFGVPRAIAAKNKYDVKNCDLVLAYMPKGELSLGTLLEIAWADAYDKQIILVTDEPKILNHPVLDATVDWKLETLAEACEVINGVLGGYVRGGKNV